MAIPPSSSQAKHPAVILAFSPPSCLNLTPTGSKLYPVCPPTPLLNPGPSLHHLSLHQSTATTPLPASPNTDKIMTQHGVAYLDLCCAPHSPSAPATLVSFLSPGHAKHRPASGPLHLSSLHLEPSSPCTHVALSTAFFKSVLRCQPWC